MHWFPEDHKLSKIQYASATWAGSLKKGPMCYHNRPVYTKKSWFFVSYIGVIHIRIYNGLGYHCSSSYLLYFWWRVILSSIQGHIRTCTVLCAKKGENGFLHTLGIFWHDFQNRLGTEFAKYWELRSEILATLPYFRVVCLDPIKVSCAPTIAAQQHSRAEWCFWRSSRLRHRKWRPLQVKLHDVMVDIPRHYISAHIYYYSSPLRVQLKQSRLC